MTSLLWLLAFIVTGLTLAYQQVSLKAATTVMATGTGIYLLVYLFTGTVSGLLGLLLLLVVAGLFFLNNIALRQEYLSKRLFALFKKVTPSMSSTEKEALEAGTIWWEGELFTGKPNWQKLQNAAQPRLSDTEQAFIDGPVVELCKMLDDWTINHEQGDLSQDIYNFIDQHGFLGLIIPKEYGGLDFSAYAQSRIITMIASVNSVAGNYISVPNSLGPGELLVKYGTQAQKDYYLPRLATGEEIPCFGLTSPRAGSDAGAIPDTGIICKGKFANKEIIGIKLNFNKRYITLAPIASLIGLAFKLYDPEHLLGEQEEYGITCALIPREMPGITIGRRHYPSGSPFMNGPIQGEDVFVPLDYIIGGPDMAGKGWRMLMECLSAGRAISLPSAALSISKRSLAATGAYARIRKQFNVPIAKFEGVQAVLARMAGFNYIIEAAVSGTTAAIDAGEEPAVSSAILKYHCTEMGRQVINDAMDIHGGKAVIKGPGNYLLSSYESTPVAITVEGANILTRSLIIFGQGAVRCHPYVLTELQATQMQDEDEALATFDKALFGHIGFTWRNAARSLFLGVTRARFAAVPVSGRTRRYYQLMERYSAAFALATDFSMLILGGSLKFREMLSARLGDLLSSLYLASMVLKYYRDQGEPLEDWPLVQWSVRHLLYQFQEQLHSLLQNLPHRWMALKLRLLVFPAGRTLTAPQDKLSRKVARLFSENSECRKRLVQGTFLDLSDNNPVGELNALLPLAEQVAPLEAKLRHAVKEGLITDLAGVAQIDAAEKAGVVSSEEADKLREYDKRVMAIINVDDFDFNDIGRKPLKRKPTHSNKATKASAAAKTTSQDTTAATTEQA